MFSGILKMVYVEKATIVGTDMHKWPVGMRLLPVNQEVYKVQLCHTCIAGTLNKAFADLVTSVNSYTAQAICQKIPVLKHHRIVL